ncbi:uncharacterized protein LOC126676198 [Mercurialis annua]|uniref:uncharacterized protein LOC126676198 n=1 Tax=Mercurialis annua TaxID=3986 RepID=UPI00215DE20A|nr:uncharacterized protein LOC126676198 [Mercurialis annua]
MQSFGIISFNFLTLYKYPLLNLCHAHTSSSSANPNIISMAYSNSAKLFSAVILVSLLLMHQPSTASCYTGPIRSPPATILPPRKVLHVVSKRLVGEEELRTVPSGPDPLHHNGRDNPKKPTSP